jgi:hypothetical protein
MSEATIYVNGEPVANVTDVAFTMQPEHMGLRSITRFLPESSTATMTIERTRKNRKAFAELECFMNGVKRHRNYRVNKRRLERRKGWRKTQRIRARGSHKRWMWEGRMAR